MTTKLTEELLNELMFTRSIDEFIEKENLLDNFTLSDYLQHLLTETSSKKSVIIERSKLNNTHGYQIFSGERKAGRDKLLQLAFAFPLNLKDTQRLLKFGGSNELYAKNKRDAIVIYCLTNNYTLDETDDTLFSFNEKTICND